ncbi:MAG: amidohydrolase [Lachnospiraceae bacterium]|nr:amidohydrolase [Lachnospiraceae bacterium]
MKWKIAMAQLSECDDWKVNVKKAEGMIRDAKAQGASMAVFPECFMQVFPKGTPSDVIIESAQSTDGPFVTEMKELASEYGMWLVFGMVEKIPDDDQHTKNTVIVTDDAGIVRDVYSKTHLFDSFGYKESKHVASGDELFTPIDTPFGKMGLFVCFELRFPEVARLQALSGADFIVMPTAWVKGEQKSHQLHTLLEARAMENEVWIACCDRCGGVSLGESALVSPLGNEIALAGADEELLIGEIDTEPQQKIRETLPAFKCRRADLYTLEKTE